MIGEVLDDDVMESSEYTDGAEDDVDWCGGGGEIDEPVLSRESPAAFLHDLVRLAAAWLAEDAADVDRFAGD